MANRKVSQVALDALLEAVRAAGGDSMAKEPKALTEHLMHCDLETDYDWILQQAAWLLKASVARKSSGE